MNPTFIIPLSPMQPVNTAGAAKTTPEPSADGGETFLDTLRSKIQDVKDLEMNSLQSAYDVALGKSDDIESAMIDATKASTAIEMTTQLTVRAVNAYKDIMEMQV